MFESIQIDFIKHDFCGKCMRMYQPHETMCATCSNNRYHVNGKKKQYSQNYFLQVPPTSIIKNVFSRPKIESELDYPYVRKKMVEANYEDVQDGSIWKRIKNHPNFNVRSSLH